MSLFLGSDTSDNKVMHITRTAHTSLEMKSGYLDDTVFHSSMPFITWEEISTSPSSSGLRHSAMAVQISEADATRIGANNLGWFFVCDGFLYSNVTISRYDSYYYGLYGYYGWGLWSAAGQYYKVSSNPIGMFNIFSFNQVCSTVKLYVINITDTSYIPTVGDGTIDILVRGNDIKVKGIDLLDLKYIRHTPLNTVDRTVSDNGSIFQLIDGSLGTGLSLVSNSTHTTIGNSSYLLFDSLNTGNFIYKGQAKYLNIPGPVYNQNNSFTIDYSTTQAKYAVVRVFGVSDAMASNCYILDITNYPEKIVASFLGATYYNGYWHNGTTNLYISASNRIITIRKSYSYQGGFNYDLAYPALKVSSYIISN